MASRLLKPVPKPITSHKLLWLIGPSRTSFSEFWTKNFSFTKLHLKMFYCNMTVILFSYQCVHPSRAKTAITRSTWTNRMIADALAPRVAEEGLQLPIAMSYKVPSDLQAKGSPSDFDYFSSDLRRFLQWPWPFLFWPPGVFLEWRWPYPFWHSGILTVTLTISLLTFRGSSRDLDRNKLQLTCERLQLVAAVEDLRRNTKLKKAVKEERKVTKARLEAVNAKGSVIWDNCSRFSRRGIFTDISDRDSLLILMSIWNMKCREKNTNKKNPASNQKGWHFKEGVDNLNPFPPATPINNIIPGSHWHNHTLSVNRILWVYSGFWGYHGILVVHLQDSVGAFGTKWYTKRLHRA